MVNRLAEQAAPLMTRLLRQYGEAHPTLRATAQVTLTLTLTLTLAGALRDGQPAGRAGRTILLLLHLHLS